MRKCINRLISGIFYGSMIALLSSPLQARAQIDERRDTEQVTIRGKQLLKDGRPWIPHGFYQVTFEVPPGAFAQELPFWRVAYENYSREDYQEMKREGADSVRFQIAQDGADRENTKFYDPEWLDEAEKAVRAARAAG